MISSKNTLSQKFGFFSNKVMLLSLFGLATAVNASTVVSVSGGSLVHDTGFAGGTEFIVDLESDQNPIWIDLKGAQSTEDLVVTLKNPNGFVITRLEYKFINENGGSLPNSRMVDEMASSGGVGQTTITFDSDNSSDGNLIYNVAGSFPNDQLTYTLEMFMTNFGEGDWSLGIGVNGADLNAVPLPAPIWLFGSSLVGLLAYRKKIEK